MRQSVFDHLASSLCVTSICRSFGPDLKIGTHVNDAYKVLEKYEEPEFDELNDPVRILNDDGLLLGLFSSASVMNSQVDQYGEGIEGDDFWVEDFVEEIKPSELIGADTTILEAVKIFARDERHRYYIVRRNEIVGYLEYAHLFKPVGRLAFLALALEIEDQARQLCQHHAFREDAWQSLPQGRRERAETLFRERHKKEPGKHDTRDLIECTYLIDKANMVWKCKLIAGGSRSGLLGTFKKLERLRNFCAHPTSVVPNLSAEELWNLVNEVKNLIVNFEDRLRTHQVSDKKDPLIIW